MSVLDVLSAAMLLSGGVFCLVGAYGMVRFPDVPSRSQAATKPQTLGLLLILLGVALQLGVSDAVGFALAAFFQVVTAPVLSQLVGRAAYRTDAVRRDILLADELRSRLERDASTPPE